jgi:hypothetical protein
MLKKSLRVGSIVVLLLSLIFFMGCSNGSTDSEDEGGNNGGGIVTPEAKVTKVTINPGNVEVGIGESYIFTAAVEGIGEYDPKVTWALLDPEEGEPSLRGTTITQRGKLTVDSLLNEGQDIWIQATAGGVSATAVVTVAPRGPYFTWAPSTYKTAPTETIVPGDPDGIYGYLRGFSKAEKDIKLKIGVLQEGVDYSIEYETGVSGARPVTDNPIITVTGTGDPYEGVLVGVNTSNVTLTDPTKRATVKITMLSGAFYGNDVAELKPGRTSLILEVTDKGAIVDVGPTLDFPFAAPNNAPTLGQAIPAGTTGAGGYFIVKSISWAPLSYQNNYIIGETKTVTASIELSASDGYYFLEEDFDETAISNAGSFKNGVPTVDKIEVSPNGKSLKFDLIYNVRGLILGKTATPGVMVDLEATAPAGAGANFGLTDIFTAAPLHTDKLPPLSLAENNYYTASLKWSGSGVVNATETTPGSFKAARLPDLFKAVATITLTPKPGYTFEGSNIVDSDFNTSGNPYFIGTPAATLMNGPEGTLILTLTYTVGEKTIGPDDVKSVNFEKIIARPIHGKPVGINSAFEDTDASPYTGTVLWDDKTRAENLYKFNIGDYDTTIGTITLKTKAGYKWNTVAAPTWTGKFQDLADAVATEAQGPVSVGFLLLDRDEIKFDIGYEDGSNNGLIFYQITSLEGVGKPAPVHADTIDYSTFDFLQAGATTLPIGTSSIWANLDNGTDAVYNKSPRVTLNIEADVTTTVIAPYTFKSYDVLTEPSLTKTDIETYFKDGDTIGVKVVEGPELIGNNIRFTLEYTVKKSPIPLTDLDGLDIGIFASTTQVASGNVISKYFTTPGTSTTYEVKPIEWEDNATDGFRFDGKQPKPGNTFAPTTKYTARITLVPNPGYTFVPFDDYGFIAFHTSVAAGAWGNAGAYVASNPATFDGLDAEVAVDDAGKETLVIELAWDLP